MADLDTTQRALLLLDDESPCIWPNYTGATSDPAVAITGDGEQFRLAVLGVGAGECDITVTRVSDNATATVHVVVGAAAAPGAFTVHLGVPFAKA